MVDIDYTYFDQLEEKWGPIYQNFTQSTKIATLKLALISDPTKFNDTLDDLDRNIIHEYKKCKVLMKYKSKSTGSKSKSRFFKMDFEHYLGYLAFLGMFEMEIKMINEERYKNFDSPIELKIKFNEAKKDLEKGLKLILESAESKYKSKITET